MKRFLKVLGILLLVFTIGGLVYGLIKHEPLPETVSSEEADVLAQKMLKALNYEAYKNTPYLEWSFRNGNHRYHWNKESGNCTVKWKDYTVNLNLKQPKESSVTQNSIPLTDSEKQKAIEKALNRFNNDSFWLVAPYKLFDKGTQRAIVNLENGEKGLLVTYTQGGSTPGDSYLWLLNENGFPNAYKMWTKIIPIGGVEASWDDWVVVESGAFLPRSHTLGPITLSMGDVKGWHWD